MRTLTNTQVKKLFGDFKYDEALNGRIVIDNDWVKKNITGYKMPIVGYVYCHKEILFDLFRIFWYLERLGLSKHINKQDFRKRGGCFVPRHKGWDSKRGLSRHSWGIAIDLNVKDNPYGSNGIMHKGIIKMFNDYGFLWGGMWSKKWRDPMHFEASNKWKPFTPVEIINK